LKNEKPKATAKQEPLLKTQDLFSLKKQVIEEIKSELNLVANERALNGSTAYVDPFSRLQA
jgi:hypothetical protein